MADARVGRDDAEVAERVLPPAQERVALAVAVELELRVLPERLRRRELVDDDRVVDHEVGRRERVDLLGVAAHRGEGLAHRREVDDGRDAREVLQEDARGAEGDLAVGRLPDVTGREGLDVVLRHGAAVLVAEEVLEEDPERERELLDLRELLLERLEAEIRVVRRPDLQAGPGLEAVAHKPSERQPAIVDGLRKRSRRCGCFRGRLLRPVCLPPRQPAAPASAGSIP